MVDLETSRIAPSSVVDLETSRIGAACIFEYAGALRLMAMRDNMCQAWAWVGALGGGSGVPWPRVFPFKYSILPQRYAKERRFP